MSDVSSLDILNQILDSVRGSKAKEGGAESVAERGQAQGRAEPEAGSQPGPAPEPQQPPPSPQPAQPQPPSDRVDSQRSSTGSQGAQWTDEQLMHLYHIAQTARLVEMTLKIDYLRNVWERTRVPWEYFVQYYLQRKIAEKEQDLRSGRVGVEDVYAEALRTMEEHLSMPPSTSEVKAGGSSDEGQDPRQVAIRSWLARLGYKP